MCLSLWLLLLPANQGSRSLEAMAKVSRNLHWWKVSKSVLIAGAVTCASKGVGPEATIPYSNTCMARRNEHRNAIIPHQLFLDGSPLIKAPFEYTIVDPKLSGSG